MYNGIGLRTVRGSGTNGYVQSNRAYVKPVNVRKVTELNSGRWQKEEQWKAAADKAGNPELLEHARKRDIEVKVFELRDRLEEEGKLDEASIDKRCDELRARLSSSRPAPRVKKLDTHAAAEAKRRDDARLRDAFGIVDHVEGAAFDRELREKLKAERSAKREEEAKQREAEAAQRRQAKADKQREAEAAELREAEAAKLREAEAAKQRDAEVVKQREAEGATQRDAEGATQRGAEAATQREAAPEHPEAGPKRREAGPEQRDAEHNMQHFRRGEEEKGEAGNRKRRQYDRRRRDEYDEGEVRARSQAEERDKVSDEGDVGSEKPKRRRVYRYEGYPETRREPSEPRRGARPKHVRGRSAGEPSRENRRAVESHRERPARRPRARSPSMSSSSSASSSSSSRSSSRSAASRSPDSRSASSSSRSSRSSDSDSDSPSDSRSKSSSSSSSSSSSE